MPSLRQKVTTYFRQLSFIADPRDGPRSPRRAHADDDDEEDEGNFITKYLEGRMNRIFVPGPEIFNGQNPTDLPVYKIGTYPTGQQTITAACTGPDEGLTGIKRSKLHLCASFTDDIDFIDTTQDADCFEVRRSINSNTSAQGRRNSGHSKFGRFNNTPRKLSNAGVGASASSTSDQNANRSATVANGTNSSVTGMRSRKNSRTSISNLNAACKESNSKAKTEENRNAEKNTHYSSGKSTTIVVSMVVRTAAASAANSNDKSTTNNAANDQNNKNVLNTKTEVNGTTATAIANANANSFAPKDVQNKASIETTSTTTTTASGLPATDNNTNKLLETTTERLLREAVSNQTPAIGGDSSKAENLCELDAVAGVANWKMESEFAYGISVSLYENNMLTKEPMGNPIADCYGMLVHGDAAIMALADGVNWGDGARLAARSAVHGCLDYLERALFSLGPECSPTTTEEVFVSLLRSLWEGHGCILEVGGALSTLTICVVLPLTRVTNAEEDDFDYAGRYVVCACNVGDSLGYVYSKTHGVREFTQASHDIASMRDMRDALGAIGPADGNKPELSNLTFSMTLIDKGDIVFLTSDGISDNFDPVVGKFAEAWTPDVKLMPAHGTRSHGNVLAPKRQNKSASALYARLHHGKHHGNDAATGKALAPNAPTRPPRSKKSSSPENVPPTTVASTGANVQAPSRPKYMRSHTVIEPRRITTAPQPSHLSPQETSHQQRNAIHHHRNPHHHQQVVPKIPKSISGLPLVTGPQRHALTIYRLEDLLSYGINGTFAPCVSARRLCLLLIDFVRMITSARRKTLEQRELFYKLSTGPDGIKREVELNRMQHRAARKRVIDSSAFSALPGKLDHATVVAYTVGGEVMSATAAGATNGGSHAAALQSKEFTETNF